jgi:hypothetical protein
MTTVRPLWAFRALFAVVLLLFTSLLTLAGTAGAAPRHAGSTHAARPSHAVAVITSRTPPRPLMLAARRARSADRILVADAKALKRCLRAHRVHPRRCDGLRHAVQRAGSRFAAAERRLAPLAGRGKTTAKSAASWESPRLAPHLIVSGQTLEWTRVAGINTYVLVRKVPGQTDVYSVVSGTSITPPPVPGQTVRYSVRTTAWWSAWAGEVAITYPPASQPPPAPDKQAAPAVSISGQTLTWNEVAGVTTYVFVRKVPGQADQYSEVSGMSVTPPAVPGATVKYSVRTAVQGSAWAPEVSISYSTGTKPPPPPPPPPPPVVNPPGGEGSGAPGPMTVGLDIGGWAWASAINDEAGAVKHVRSDFKHFNSDSQMELLAKAGVTLMPLFGEGGTLAQYDNPGFFGEIVAWFKRYGKGGTFWQGKPVDLGATTCELINEPGNPYFYSDYSNHQLYANMTKAVHSALEEISPANRPKLLVSYDGGFNGSQYGREIFAAGAVADGVTVHPYGGKNNAEQSALGGRERVTQAHAETGLPVYVTEVGWPTAVGAPPTGDSLQWSEAQQAENITRFVKWARELQYVGAVVYFNYADYGSNDFYGIVHSSGSGHKLGYEALRLAAASG